MGDGDEDGLLFTVEFEQKVADGLCGRAVEVAGRFIRQQQKRLATALDVVARTEIRLLEGDALDMLPVALADTPSPICVYHSACLMYWSKEAKRALDELLQEASRDRAR